MAAVEAEPAYGRAAEVGWHHQHLPLLQDEGEYTLSAHPVVQYDPSGTRVDTVRKGSHAVHIHDPAVVPSDQPVARGDVLCDVEAGAIGRGADAEHATEDRLVRPDRAAQRDIAHQGRTQ